MLLLNKFAQIVKTHRQALGPLGCHEEGSAGASIPQGLAGFRVVIDEGRSHNHPGQTPGVRRLQLVVRIQIRWNFHRLSLLLKASAGRFAGMEGDGYCWRALCLAG